MFPKPLGVSDMVLKNRSGKTVSLSDFRGKVVLLHFWSIQCPACHMEEPQLDKVRRTFGPSGLEILGVNLVDQPQAIFNHCASNKVAFSGPVRWRRRFQSKGVQDRRKDNRFCGESLNRKPFLRYPAFRQHIYWTAEAMQSVSVSALHAGTTGAPCL